MNEHAFHGINCALMHNKVEYLNLIEIYPRSTQVRILPKRIYIFFCSTKKLIPET